MTIESENDGASVTGSVVRMYMGFVMEIARRARIYSALLQLLVPLIHSGCDSGTGTSDPKQQRGIR